MSEEIEPKKRRANAWHLSEVPVGSMKLASVRTDGLLRFIKYYPICELLRAAYLQGITDAALVIDKHEAK